VVEVVSPGKVNEDRDYRYKRSEYAVRGIPEYWIIDSAKKQVTVLTWADGFYLKDHPEISQKTKKAVIELATQLDYKPNSLALSLRQNKSFTLGVIIPQIVHYFFSTVIDGIEEVAHEAGYNVIVSQSAESYEREVNNVNALFASRVDGMLVSITRHTTDFEHFETMRRKGVPLVFFDRLIENLEGSFVTIDDFQGGFMATEHLIQQGCRRIAHLTGPDTLSITRKRKEGYLAALQKYEIPFEESLITYSIKGLMEEGEEATKKYLLSLANPPDGIFANNDMAALGAMQAVKKQGFTIPEDIAIIGFSDWQLSALVDPPLSSIAQSGFQIGKASTEILLDQIESGKKQFPSIHKVLQPEVISRASSLKK